MHYHVGTNLAGQEPKVEDAICCDDKDDAGLELERLLEDQMDTWAERCPHFGNDPEWVGCACGWCSLALNVERFMDSLEDAELWAQVRAGGQGSVAFTEPAIGGDTQEFWVRQMNGESCDAS
ncbi:hypothetical protein [Streptomyces rimosus]|uniref:hypothetical protein n=1 Tax=Streptomyces rimosus TaxID=1927 RepID=UPI0004CB106F|nr:hypothetical protein [Streptomyces rimosus]